MQPLDQQLEGHVLVVVGGQAARAHLRQHLGNTGITGQVHAQYQGVDEKPDQIIEGGIMAPGDRESDSDLGAGAEFGQQHRQPGLHHHETGRVVLARQSRYLLLQLRRPVNLDAGAAVIGHRRVGPIGRKRQPLGQPGQGLLPIGQLGGDRAAGIGQLPQLGALPQRVIDILHRQRRPARGPAGTAGGIGHPQIPQQRGNRQAIGGDVVGHGHQHMLVLAETEKLCPQRDLGRQIKAVTGERIDGFVQPLGRPAARVNDLPAKTSRLRRHHQLAGCAFGCGKQRAQTFLTAHHIGHRGPERLGVQPPAQLQRDRQVVDR